MGYPQYEHDIVTRLTLLPSRDLTDHHDMLRFFVNFPICTRSSMLKIPIHDEPVSLSRESSLFLGGSSSKATADGGISMMASLHHM